MRATTTRRAAALAAALALCAPLGAAPARDSLTLSFKEKVIKNLSSSGLVLAFHIAVDNGYAKPRELVRYRYRVRIDQKEYINTTVVLPEPLAVPAGGQTLIALPVKISYDLLKAALGPVEDKALCDVVGDMYFRNDRNREEKIAFAYSGEFPVFQDPEIDLLPLKVNDLTVGGADVVFRPRFKNGNRYELIVDRIDFTLAFSGREVLAGPIEGGQEPAADGEKTFALPFILDFFEAGEDVRAGFDKDEFPCRFAGRIEIASVWGRLVILFDKTQNVRLERASR